MRGQAARTKWRRRRVEMCLGTFWALAEAKEFEKQVEARSAALCTLAPVDTPPTQAAGVNYEELPDLPDSFAAEAARSALQV